MVMMSSLTTPLKNGNLTPYGNEIENKRDWGEERHDDVIYAVTLRRVRKTPSPAHEVADGLQWETQKVRCIKGATLPFLAGRLCRFFVDDFGEQNFLTVFLATYRSFATPTEVVDLVIAECDKLKEDSQEKKTTTLSSMIRVMKTWLETYFDEDFYDPPHHPLLKKIESFAEDCRQDEAVVCQIKSPSLENECGFLNFIQSKIKAAEDKMLREKIGEDNLDKQSPSFRCNVPDNIQDAKPDKECLNLNAAKKFLYDFSVQQIAEQLTLKDANLFLRVVPFHCLKAVRSSKHKPASVKATIEQFNRVVYCVLGTCLCPDLKTSLRAKVLCKWIEVAQECRELKNFSSLRAVVSGLQTHSIHRLKRTWQHIPHNLCDLLKELGQINMKDLIKKVGTAKVNTEKSSISKVRKDASTKRQQAIHLGIMHGTVPYLGSFLTDLTYLDTAKPDYLEKRFINFHKRRLEFEVLAQLQLWQASCQSYKRLESDPLFFDWLSSVTLPTDDQAIQLSNEIEPPNAVPPSPVAIPGKLSVYERFSNHNGGFESSSNPSTPAMVNHTRIPSNELTDLRISESDVAMTKANGQVTVEDSSNKGRAINVQVIKKLTKNEDVASGKSKEMKLSSNDRSPAFKKKAFSLFEIDEDNLQNFTLVQLLPEDKELVIPENANVFYAMNSSTRDYNFVLLEVGAELPKEKPESRAPTTPLSTKPKQHQRKATSSTSSSVSASPMKSIYRHLGMSGLSLSSGFYSPAKETSKQEKAPEEKSDNDFRFSSEQKPGKSENEAAIRGSENPADDNERSRRQKMWKAFSWSKGHRRNFSDFGLVGRGMTENPASHLNAPQLVYAINDTLVFPLSTPEHPDISIPGSDSSELDWTSSAEDYGYGIPTTSTWPRNFDFSVSEPQKFHRQTAIRKHHSHPRDAVSNRQLSEFEIPANAAKRKLGPKPILKSERKTGFYSKLSNKLEKSSKTIRRSSSSEQMQPLRENKVEDVFIQAQTRNFARAASDPLILRLPENEVFEADETLPVITIQCPTPNEIKKSEERKTQTSSELLSSGETKPRVRLSSETRTTIL